MSDITTTLSEHSMLTRLEQLTRRVRGLLVLYGVCVMVVIGLGTLTGLILLDWIFILPAVLRFGLMLIWLVLLAYLFTSQVARPWRWPDLLGHLADKIEQRYPEFEERLSSAISFLREAPSTEDPLKQALIRNTQELASKLPLEQAVVTAPLWRVAGAAGVTICCWLTGLATNPSWMTTGVQRWMVPFVAPDWPRSTEIIPLTGPILLARGESAVVAMELRRGAKPTLRGYLHLEKSNGESERITMRQEGPARYAWNLPTVTQPLRYWFEAGDDNTRNQPFTIEVVDRPQVTHLRLEVLPPDYLSDRAAESIPAGQKSISMISGSALRVELSASKPLARREDGSVQAWIQNSRDQKQLTPITSEPMLLVAELRPTSDESYEFVLVDVNGFENSDRQKLTVNLRPDAPPTVSLQQPVETVSITPAGEVAVAATIRDDLGISSITLRGTIREPATPFQHEINEWTASRELNNQNVVNLRYDWPLASMNLQPGQSVEGQLVAEDNRRIGELLPQSGSSYKWWLKVVTPAELLAQISDELNQLAKRLRLFLDVQERLLPIMTAWKSDEPSTEAAERTLQQLSSQQRQLLEQLSAIRRQAEQLGERLRRNNLEGGREPAQAAMVETQLRNVAEPALAEANRLLGALRAATEPDPAATMSQATQQVQQATTVIRRLLNELSLWDDLNSVLLNLRELVDLQQQTSRQTAEVQNQTLGKSLEELSEAERKELQRTTEQQERVSRDLQQAMENLQRLADKLRRDDPEQALAVAEARRRLEAQAASQHSDQAAQAIRQNQTGTAISEQNQVERALNEATRELENRQSRELAELSKKLNQVEEIFRFLLEQQRELLKQAQAIQEADADQAPELGQRQRVLSQNIAPAVESLSQMPQAAEAEIHARLAGELMVQAAQALYDTHIEPAVAAQQGAIQALEKVVTLLTELREENEKAQQREKLLAMRRELEALRERQLPLNNATQQLAEQVHTTGELRRKEARQARKLAGDQTAIQEMLTPIRERLGEAPVYLWIAGKIDTAMTTSREYLDATRFEPPLEVAQARIITQLNQLIEAIAAAEQMVDEQFAEGPASGGSGAGQADEQSQPVPTVAELLILKTIQQDINERTRQLQNLVAEQSADERQLTEMRQLAQEQGELLILTQQLTEKARGRQQ
ncbi:MAG: hypothetical protein HJJLKODD_01776 [Phycisphaerae bacterium]|nr:hypothetical protein [Phycisphaerae bacterium]